MDITAIIAVRNAEKYIGNCLRQLMSDGINFYVLDNQSDDMTSNIVNSDEFSKRLVGFKEIPFSGEFDLTEQLKEKGSIIAKLDADWIIHLDADEVIQSYNHGESLSDAIARVDYDGYTVINCDEMVFIPLDMDYQSDSFSLPDMHYYYFFEPRSNRLQRIWKNGQGIGFADTGGHSLMSEEQDRIKYSPNNFVLRHYPFLNQEHAKKKYTSRKFAGRDLKKGWHGNRIGISAEQFIFPQKEKLKYLDNPILRDFDLSDPQKNHYWEWEVPRQSLWKKLLARIGFFN